MSPSPTHTDRLALLSDPTRRRICTILCTPDPPVSERDLAVELATRCLDRPAAEITDAQRRQQRVRLRHHQLPKLADYGLLVYDQSTEMVSLTDAGAEALAAHTRARQAHPTAATASSD